MNVEEYLYNNLHIPVKYLKEQYRMSKELIEFSNNYFYQNIIQSKKTSNYKFFNESCILFVDTFNSIYKEEVFENSKYNIEEVKIIQCLLDHISKELFEHSIGIIVPYSAQVSRIKEIITNYNLNICVNTVDSFQGQEKDIIIISMVRCNENEIGFMRDIRRMNVAMTRCKEGLVVIGNSSAFTHCRYYKEMFQFLDKSAFTFDHENFLYYLESINYN